MKTLLYYLTIAFVLFTAHSCNNDFLNENLDIQNVPASDYTIFISPEWETDDYLISIPGAGNVDFKISKHPEWLELETMSGKLINGLGIVNCKAKIQSKFSDVGIYLDKMEVVVGDNKYYVPVAYVTEGKPKATVQRTLNLTYSSYMYPQISIQNIGQGLLFWEITEMPGWMSVNLDEVDPRCFLLSQHQSCNLPIKINTETVPTTNFSGKIYLKTNDKENKTIEITISVSLGNPNIYPNMPVLIDFGRANSEKTFYFSNQGNGLLVWSIEGLPDWLTIDQYSGILSAYDSKILTLTCQRDLLPEGLTEAKFSIKSNAGNAPVLQITARARKGNNSANVKAVEGAVVDVEYDRNTDMLYLATSRPNKFIVFNTSTRAVDYEIPLEKAPTCLAVSEDRKVAAVGHGGQISFLNLESKNIIKVYDLLYTVYDIAWGDGDWFCFTKAESSFSNLVWYNYKTNETMETVNQGSGYLDGATNIGKFPHQPYVLAARRQTSPTGIILIDAAIRQSKNYRHRSIGKFWFSDDGQFMSEDNGNIYKINSIIAAPSTISDDLLPIGKIKHPSQSYGSFKWIDHSSNGKSIWAIRRINYDDISPEILQFEDNDYTYVKSVYSDEIYQLNNVDYTVYPHYVFVNGAGTQLTVLRAAKDVAVWSFEFIALN